MMQFEYVEGYYSTYLHEAIHSTGHSRRLNRKGLQNVEFGSEKYSFEELVAEIGSAALTSQLGISTDRSSLNSTGYCQNWAKTLNNDKKMIVFAASQAEKAVRFINM